MSNEELGDEYRRVNKIVKAAALRGEDIANIQKGMCHAFLNVLWDIAAAALI